MAKSQQLCPTWALLQPSVAQALRLQNRTIANMWAHVHSTSYITHTHTSTHRMQGRCIPTWRRTEENISISMHAGWCQQTETTRKNSNGSMLCAANAFILSAFSSKAEWRGTVTSRLSDCSHGKNYINEVYSTCCTTCHGVGSPIWLPQLCIAHYLPIPAPAWVECGGLHLWVQDYEIVSFC